MTPLHLFGHKTALSGQPFKGHKRTDTGRGWEIHSTGWLLVMKNGIMLVII